MTSTTSFLFRVTFEGESPVIVESESGVPGMLPWKVTVGDRTWVTWSFAVSRALRRLVSSSAPEHHSLVTGERFWSTDLWRDQLVWRELEDAVEKHAAKKIYSALPGYDEARSAWDVEEQRSSIGRINSAPFGLHLMLSKRVLPLVDRDADVINGAWWWNPIVAGKTTVTWHEFLSAHARATAAIRDHVLLREWKRASPDREVELHVLGADAAGDEPIEGTVLPAWRAAGLKGRPEFDIMLRDGHRMGEVFFGSQDRRAIVVWMTDAAATSHWLDSEVLYFRGAGSYVVVEPDGRHERR